MYVFERKILPRNGKLIWSTHYTSGFTKLGWSDLLSAVATTTSTGCIQLKHLYFHSQSIAYFTHAQLGHNVSIISKYMVEDSILFCRGLYKTIPESFTTLQYYNTNRTLHLCKGSSVTKFLDLCAS